MKDTNTQKNSHTWTNNRLTDMKFHKNKENIAWKYPEREKKVFQRRNKIHIDNDIY